MNTPTPCAEYEGQLPEYLEGLLAAADRPAVAAHVTACPACRAFAQAWQSLDNSLQRAIRGPRLSPQFEARLRHRIAVEAPGLSPAEREAKKRAWEAEFAQRTRTWRGRVMSVVTVLDGLGLGVLAAAFGLAAWLWLPKLINAYHLTIPSNLPQSVISGGLTVIVVLIALAAAFWRPARKIRLLR
jgi:anti-sigma factor RsiW